MTFEQQKDTKAISISIGIHLLLLLIFFFYKYTLPYQEPVEEWGMEVNLGTVEDAYGMNQPELLGDPSALIAINNRSTSEQDAVDIRQTFNAEDGEPVHVTAQNSQRNARNQSTVSERNTATPAPTPRYSYINSAGTGGNAATQNAPGDNEGIGQGTGDMGVPNGTPGADNYAGSPGSGNMQYSLGARKLVRRPSPEATFRSGGTVKIFIVVNREGDIIRHSFTEVPNEELRRLAEQKLKGVKFNQVSDARNEESGTITFEFKSTR